MLSYVASKGALIGMTRTLAVGLGGDGIAVTAVAPGLMLAREDAAALTGQTVTTDGGLVMR
jgi:3-oxoacyl-[acyl-carrier protein] reductase